MTVTFRPEWQREVDEYVSPLLAQDRLLPFTVGINQRTFALPDTKDPIYVSADDGIGFKCIGYDAHILRALALLLPSQGPNIYLNQAFSDLISPLDFNREKTPVSAFRRLSGYEITIVKGNTPIRFRLGGLQHSGCGIPYFAMSDQLAMALTAFPLPGNDTMAHPEVAQPLALRLIRAFEKSDIYLDSYNTFDYLASKLMLYTGDADSVELKLLQNKAVAKKLMEIEASLIKAGRIDKIAMDIVYGSTIDYEGLHFYSPESRAWRTDFP